jgi:CubicO group peptidase (beta-lactamase class C family)
LKSVRSLTMLLVLATVVAVWTPGEAASLRQMPTSPSTNQDQAAAIGAIAQDAMTKYHSRAVILRVTVDGQDVVTQALGDSMTGVPATTDMHFRNGAVAISYVSTLLLELVDQGKVNLDDKLSNWLPDLPYSDQVTLRMLANMTAGYADYVTDPTFAQEVNQEPFRQWTPQELIDVGMNQGQLYPPGTSWNYAHTDYVILGQALEKLMGQPMDVLMREYIFAPMGLMNTEGFDTPEIPSPVLHAFSGERRGTLGIDPSTPFYEESSFWNPSWTITHGAIQTTNIYDMATTARAVGEGTLLTPESHTAQVAPDLVGVGGPAARLPHLLYADERALLRPRGLGRGLVDTAKPALFWLRRHRGVFAVQEDCHRGGQHLRRRELGRTGELPLWEPQSEDLRGDRRLSGS